MKALVWLRSDLRIDDNPAFLNACEAYDEVSCIYIFSRKTWYKNNNSNVKEHFVLENLAKLKNVDNIEAIPNSNCSCFIFNIIKI